jgi:hypothetical protein
VANLTQEELEALNRDELNEVAEEAGVDDPESLPNKQAVIDAINAEVPVDDSDSSDDDEDDDDVVHTSDPEARVEGVENVQPDPSTETHASDAADYPFPPSGDVDVGKLSDERLEGESDPVIQPDSRVLLGDTENVPDYLQGHPALVVAIQESKPGDDPDDEGKEVFEVRTRDEHNSTLFLERDDFAEVYPGNVGLRGFGT